MTTSRAYANFEHGIRDADELLAHFDALNVKPPPPKAEVLKRAGLVMALTAWETYVEDRLIEAMERKLSIVSGSQIGNFVMKRLQQDIKQLHNPHADRTRRLFLDYLGLDVTAGWAWAHYDKAKAAATLDALIAKRGEAVHRSRPPLAGSPAAHLVKREELEKGIRFIKELVRAMDEFLLAS